MSVTVPVDVPFTITDAPITLSPPQVTLPVTLTVPFCANAVWAVPAAMKMTKAASAFPAMENTDLVSSWILDGFISL